MDYSKIEFHEAIKISDYYGSIFNNEILTEINEGDIVRISIVVHNHYLESWSHDSPYVEILKKEVNVDDIVFVGEIYDFKREKNDKYPIPVGERVLFRASNIIEFPINLQKNLDEKRKLGFMKYFTYEKITVTGPLYTIKIQDETSVSDSDKWSETESSADSEESSSYISDSD